MSRPIRIAVILSGCGVLDGSEIHEAVMILLAVAKQNADYQCFAPDKPQKSVKNHHSGMVENTSRSILAESARIARGQIRPLGDYSPNDFSAVIFPGGFGAALNLCDFAVRGAKAQVDDGVASVINETYAQGKPIGALCIAPALLALVLGKNNIKVTIGNETSTMAAILETGAKHENCKATEVCVDLEHKIVTCPCYMLAQSITEIEIGAKRTVEEIIKMVIDKG